MDISERKSLIGDETEFSFNTHFKKLPIKESMPRRSTGRRSENLQPSDFSSEDMTIHTLLNNVLKEKKSRRSLFPKNRETTYRQLKASVDNTPEPQRMATRLSKSFLLPENHTANTTDSEDEYTSNSDPLPHSGKLTHKLRSRKQITLDEFASRVKNQDFSSKPGGSTVMKKGKRTRTKPSTTVLDFAAAVDLKRQNRRSIGLPPNDFLETSHKRARKQTTLANFTFAVDKLLAGEQKTVEEDSLSRSFRDGAMNASVSVGTRKNRKISIEQHTLNDRTTNDISLESSSKEANQDEEKSTDGSNHNSVQEMSPHANSERSSSRNQRSRKSNVTSRMKSFDKVTNTIAVSDVITNLPSTSKHRSSDSDFLNQEAEELVESQFHTPQKGGTHFSTVSSGRSSSAKNPKSSEVDDSVKLKSPTKEMASLRVNNRSSFVRHQSSSESDIDEPVKAKSPTKVMVSRRVDSRPSFLQHQTDSESNIDEPIKKSLMKEILSPRIINTRSSFKRHQTDHESNIDEPAKTKSPIASPHVNITSNRIYNERKSEANLSNTSKSSNFVRNLSSPEPVASDALTSLPSTSKQGTQYSINEMETTDALNELPNIERTILSPRYSSGLSISVAKLKKSAKAKKSKSFADSKKSLAIDTMLNQPSTSGHRNSNNAPGSQPNVSPVTESQPQRNKGQGASTARKKGPKRVASAFGKQSKGIFQHFAEMPVEKDALPLVEEAVESFFKNMVGDLETYTRHAGRRTVLPADVILLMKRQRLITKNHSLQFLASKYLLMEQREKIIPCIGPKGKIFP